MPFLSDGLTSTYTWGNYSTGISITERAFRDQVRYQQEALLAQHFFTQLAPFEDTNQWFLQGSAPQAMTATRAAALLVSPGLDQAARELIKSSGIPKEPKPRTTSFKDYLSDKKLI